MKFTHFIAVSAALLGLCACTTVQSTWYKDYDDNQLEIKSGLVGEYKRFASVTNTKRTWVGIHAGGEEKISARKEFLHGVAKEEIEKACMGKKSTELDAPRFTMLDTDPMVYGGGLIGSALAYGLSDDERLPTAVTVIFRCEGDKIEEE